MKFSDILNFILFAHACTKLILSGKFQFQGFNCDSGNKKLFKMHCRWTSSWQTLKKYSFWQFPKLTSMCYAIIGLVVCNKVASENGLLTAYLFGQGRSFYRLMWVFPSHTITCKVAKLSLKVASIT